MSTALANVSRLKPEIRLAQAVSQFEADLPNECKTEFRNCRSSARNSPPDQTDIMRFAAEVDRVALGRASGGRCFGPRLINFLEAVQQFAALGDLIVGGSQNIIACGVWALVRMSLLLISNSTSYLEKLSVLFMNVGRSAPRYQRMALLYPRSKDLQSSLFEYYIVVVHLCHRLLKFTQTSVVGQLISSFSDSSIKTYQSELDFWANAVKEEVSVLLIHKIEDDAQENSRFRALSNKFSQTASHYRKLKTKLRLLDSCSTYDHVTTWKQTRKVGNTTIFHQDIIYQDWMSRSNSCTLIYKGKLGSGKSVLLANIVNHLNTSMHVPKTNTVVAYFFCRHDIHESLKARTVIGSLARQLLHLLPDLSVAAELLDEVFTSSAFDFDEIFILLKRALPPDFKAYFILDGLDECGVDERESLIGQLGRLQQSLVLHICVSARPEVANQLGPRLNRSAAPSIISIPHENPDIEAFIGAELKTRLQSGKLAIGDPNLILEIHTALQEGAQGMFLWVALQIESLCMEKTDEAIRQSLLDLPKDLSETFSRILRRSENSEGRYQKRILELITVAQRPLTTEELREALSVVPSDITWNPARLLNDLHSTLTCCGSLIAIDEEELTVRLVHHSAKQFLLNTCKESNGIPFTIDSAHREMAAIIITYLNYDILGTQLSTNKFPSIMTGSVPSRIIHSALNSASNSRSLALKLLKSRKQPSHDISKILAGAKKHFDSRSVDEFQFFLYAKAYWMHHAEYIPEKELCGYKLFDKLLEKHITDIGLKKLNGQTLLSSALQSGDQILINILHKAGKIDIKDQAPLFSAIQDGDRTGVKLLLNTGKIDLNLRDSFGQTPLFLATKLGNKTIAKLLANANGIDLNIQESYRDTPLQSAIRLRHDDIVKLLLDTGKIDINLKDSRGYTPLLTAVNCGCEGIIKLLLDIDNVDVNSADIYGQTPLLLAASSGSEGIVELLLDADNVDVNLKNHKGWTPFSRAIFYQHESIVKLLVETGKVDINTKDEMGYTALSLAKERPGNEAIIKLLRSYSTV